MLPYHLYQIGKGVRQGCILSPCLFNLYAAYIMQKARLDESQAGIKSARRNINNLGYADDTTLMAESEEELKSLLMKVHPPPSLAWLSSARTPRMVERQVWPQAEGPSLVAWRIPGTGEPHGRLSMGSHRVGHD